MNGQQLSLYYPAPEPKPRARRRDPATSHEAAARAEGMAVNHRNRIIAALTEPSTIKELAARLGDIDHVAVARRMSELEELGVAKPTAERRQGCRVWIRA